jgi:hypothetical protein
MPSKQVARTTSFAARDQELFCWGAYGTGSIASREGAVSVGLNSEELLLIRRARTKKIGCNNRLDEEDWRRLHQSLTVHLK